MISSADELPSKSREYPPRTEPPLSSLPKVNDNTGVSSFYIPNETIYTGGLPESSSIEDSIAKWYVLRIRYNHDRQAYDELHSALGEVFYATHHVYKRINGHIRKVEESMLPGLLFARASRIDIMNFRHGYSPMAEYVRFYRDKTKEKTDFGMNPPLVVADKVMNSFMSICRADNIHSRVFTEEERKKLVPGAYVRVVDGYFKGVEGRIVKVKRQRCVLVDIKGLCSISTAYVPNPCLEVINESEE